MIEVKDIVKSFDGLRVLDGVSLTVADGEFLSIVGPSGAGKTTLLQIIGSLDAPDSGAVIYDGTDIVRMKEQRLARFRNLNMGFVFQFHQLLPEFTVTENVALPAMIAGESRRKAMSRAGELLGSSASATAWTTSQHSCREENASARLWLVLLSMTHV